VKRKTKATGRGRGAIGLPDNHGTLRSHLLAFELRRKAARQNKEPNRTGKLKVRKIGCTKRCTK